MELVPLLSGIERILSLELSVYGRTPHENATLAGSCGSLALMGVAISKDSCANSARGRTANATKDPGVSPRLCAKTDAKSSWPAVEANDSPCGATREQRTTSRGRNRHWQERVLNDAVCLGYNLGGYLRETAENTGILMIFRCIPSKDV